MGVVRTADGYINIAVGGPGQWKSFCAAIGHPRMHDDPRYTSQDLRLRNRNELNAELAGIFATRPSADWLGALEQAGVPAGPIYKMDEVFDDVQVKHLGIAVPVETEDGRRTAVVGQPLALSRTPPQVTHLLPEAGADNDAVLRDVGFNQTEIETLRREKVI
jgi:crotonobetainyl-CoA:carnitine CoA-transferase CaiB-like acyl-CoA transferase